MTLDPRIPMMGQPSNGLASFMQGQEDNKRNQLLDLQIQNQQSQADKGSADADMSQLKAQYMPILAIASQIKSMGGATPNNLQQIDSLIARSGANSESVQQSRALLQSGDVQRFNAELDNVLNTGAQMGWVSAPKSPYSNIRADKSGNLWGISTKTGTFEKMPTPEGAEFGSAGTTVNLDLKDRGTELEALAKSRVKRFEELLETADNAMDQDEQLSQLEQINTQTGFGMQARGTLAAAVNSIFGENVGDAFFDVNSSAIQAYNALSNKMVNSELNKAKGPQTEGDAKRARDTIANITNEQLANQFIVNSLKATNARKVEQAVFYQAVLERDGSLKNADKEWAGFKRDTPMLASVVKNASTGLPLFFNEFKTQAEAANPGIKDDQIIEIWRDLEAGKSIEEIQRTR